MSGAAPALRGDAKEMADKEYLLGNNARELLKYTNQATKPVTDDVSVRDVRTILKKIAALDDITKVRETCGAIIGQLDRKERHGFSKRGYKNYGEDMCLTAKEIIRDIHEANGKQFETEYDERLKLIDKVLGVCNLLLEYIQICIDAGYVTVEKSGIWTKKVTDVKYMAASWKKKDGARAAKLRAEKKAQEDIHQVELVKTAIREAREEAKRPSK